MDILSEVEAIINTTQAEVDSLQKSAIEKAEPLIKAAVRDYLGRHKLVTGFAFGMGTFFWLIGNNTVTELPGTSAIESACLAFLDAYGTITWRIDRKDGILVEREDW
jgi:hypothetical protein